MTPGDQVPQPDPTVLTTEQLLREVDRVRELMSATLDGVESLITEKFNAIEKHLKLVENQRIEQKADTKAAVDAALQAAKEAVKEQTTASERAIAKSETATTKSIDQLAQTFNTAFAGQQAIITDMKDRITKNETARLATREKTEDFMGTRNITIGQIIAAVAVLISLSGVIVAIITH